MLHGLTSINQYFIQSLHPIVVLVCTSPCLPITSVYLYVTCSILALLPILIVLRTQCGEL